MFWVFLLASKYKNGLGFHKALSFDLGHLPDKPLLILLERKYSQWANLDPKYQYKKMLILLQYRCSGKNH